jgi:hypothetical protein
MKVTGPTGARAVNEEEESETRDIEVGSAGRVRVERGVRR